MELLKYFHRLTIYPENAAKLKDLILDLAIRGKLTEEWRKENVNIEPASILIDRIREERERLIKEEKIKKHSVFPSIKKDEIPFDIPLTWEWSRLCTITHNFGQKTPNHTFTYIDVGAIDNQKGMISDEFQVLEAKDAPSRARKIVNEGCIIYSTVRPYLLNIAIIEQNFLFEPIVSTAFAVLNPLACISNKYLFHYLRSNPFIKYVESKMLGMAYPAINDEKLLLGCVPLPPTVEQKEIVLIIEKLFKEIEELEKQTQERIALKEKFGTATLNQLINSSTSDELAKNWSFTQKHFHTFFNEAANIKKLRETILQLAVQGKLTADWRKQNPNAEPASELLKRIKAEKEKLIAEKKIKKESPLSPIGKEEIPYELPDGWVWSRIDEFCFKVTDGFHHTPKKITNGIKYISATHIKDDGIKWEDCLFIAKKEHLELYKKTYPQKGEILIVNRGAGCGTPAIIDVEDHFSFQNAALIGFNHELINSRYIYYFLLNKRKGIMDYFIRGGAQPMLSNKMLKTLLVPLPSLLEQKEIISKVNQLMTLCDELEKQVKQSKEEVEKLMQAVLREVFEVKKEVENVL